MKKYLFLILELICICYFFSISSYAQNLDTLKYYKSKVDKYKYEDTTLIESIKHKLINFVGETQNDTYLFYAYYTLGEIFKLNGEYEIAIQYYFNALEYSDNIENKNEIADIYDDLVFIYKNRGEIERMFESISKAIAIKENIGNLKGVHKTKLYLMLYYRDIGDYIEAFRIGYDALDFYENKKDTSNILMMTHHIAMVYKSLGNYAKALKMIENVNKYLIDNKFIKEKSSLYNGKGTIQLKLGDYQDALQNFLQSLEIEQKIGNKFRILTRYNNIGITYAYLRNFDPAINYFNICIAEYKKSGRWRDLANLYNSVGMCYEEMNLPDSSIHYYLKSIEICEDFNFKEIHMKSALWVSKIYDKIGKVDSAYIFLKMYHNLFEIIDQSGMAWEITAEEFEYMRHKEKRIKQVEKRNVVLINIIIAGVLIFIILFSWIIVIKLRARVHKSQLAKQKLEKHEIELKNQINDQNKELVSKILQLSDHNSGVKFTIQKLMKLKSEMGVNSKQKIQQVINDLEHSINSNIWNEFEHRFMKVHPILFKNLMKYYPNLTPNERRLCALIHLNFSSKEIAYITKQTHQSILVAKSRLKNKLNIKEPDKITDLLHKLTQNK